MGPAFPFSQPASGPFHRIGHTGIDLFLHRPVFCPSNRHESLLFLLCP
jgi:hypothetical protein